VKEPVRLMAVKDISVESGALEMANSLATESYLTNAAAMMTGRGIDEAKKAVSELPLERRYVWRIVSSLRQAFCDFDKASLRLDLATMNADDFDTVMEAIHQRPVQFCMFLRTVLGAVEMEAVVRYAVDIAKNH
jgi:hypothetical protein